MKEITVNEIAENTGINFNTVKARIAKLGIKEVRKVGKTNVYEPSVEEKVKNFSIPVGRPPKVKPTKKQKKSRAK